MKGISHFLAGVAAATFVPGVVESAAQGSYLIVLGGFFGLLPDTLDFKFARYFEHHVNIDPDPANLDPQVIATAVAAEIDRAAETGQAIRVQLHNIPLGPNRWRQYRIRFDVERSEVVITIGPIVNAALAPLDESGQRVARVKTKAKIDYTYEGEMTADIWNGPSFAFVPKAQVVEVQFLPWHRAWSHSFTLAARAGPDHGRLVRIDSGGAGGVPRHVGARRRRSTRLSGQQSVLADHERSIGGRATATFRRCDSELSGGVDGAGADSLQPRSVFRADPESRADVDAADLLHDDADRARADLDRRVCVGTAQTACRAPRRSRPTSWPS